MLLKLCKIWILSSKYSEKIHYTFSWRKYLKSYCQNLKMNILWKKKTSLNFTILKESILRQPHIWSSVYLEKLRCNSKLPIESQQNVVWNSLNNLKPFYLLCKKLKCQKMFICKCEKILFNMGNFWHLDT